VLSEWTATLALAFNDLAYVHRQFDETYSRPVFEYFYFLRVALGHFNEAAAYLDRTAAIPEVAAYAASLGTKERELYADCLRRYRSRESLIAQVRNLSAFHYPKLDPRRQRRPVKSALADLADEDGSIFKAATGTIGESRLLFADDIASKLFQHGARDDADLLDAHGEIKEAIQSFMRFANGALDEWWTRAAKRGVRFVKRPGQPPSFGKLMESSGGESETPPQEQGSTTTSTSR